MMSNPWLTTLFKLNKLNDNAGPGRGGPDRPGQVRQLVPPPAPPRLACLPKETHLTFTLPSCPIFVFFLTSQKHL